MVLLPHLGGSDSHNGWISSRGPGHAIEVPQGETKQELLQAAEPYGVTEQQLARWHRKGLIPKPEQISLGKGHGSLSVYLPGTKQQLLALCEIHIRGREKRIPYVAWPLWWAGYDVSIGALHEFLMPLAEGWERLRDEYRDPETGELSEKAWKIIDASSEKPPTRAMPMLPGRIRRRDTPTLTRIMLQAFIGAYETYQWKSEFDGGDSEEQIVNRAFTLPLMKSEDWAELSDALRAFSPVEYLRETSYEDLARARGQVQFTLEYAKSVARSMGPLGKAGARMFEHLGPRNEGMVVLTWKPAQSLRAGADSETWKS